MKTHMHRPRIRAALVWAEAALLTEDALVAHLAAGSPTGAVEAWRVAVARAYDHSERAYGVRTFDSARGRGWRRLVLGYKLARAAGARERSGVARATH